MLGDGISAICKNVPYKCTYCVQHAWALLHCTTASQEANDDNDQANKENYDWDSENALAK